MKLIIHPNCEAHSDGAFILVNSKRFNLKWCQNNLQGIVLSDIDCTGQVDQEAFRYAASRLRNNSVDIIKLAV